MGFSQFNNNYTKQQPPSEELNGCRDKCRPETNARAGPLTLQRARVAGWPDGPERRRAHASSHAFRPSRYTLGSQSARRLTADSTVPEVVIYIKTIFQPFNCRPSVPSLSVWPLINNTLYTYLPLLYTPRTHICHVCVHALYLHYSTLVHTPPVSCRCGHNKNRLECYRESDVRSEYTAHTKLFSSTPMGDFRHIHNYLRCFWNRYSQYYRLCY